jgi:hypothetical protein
VYILLDEGMCCYDGGASERRAIGGVSHIFFFELRGRFCELEIINKCVSYFGGAKADCGESRNTCWRI